MGYKIDVKTYTYNVIVFILFILITTSYIVNGFINSYNSYSEEYPWIQVLSEYTENSSTLINYTGLPYINSSLNALKDGVFVYALIARLGNNRTADMEYYIPAIHHSLYESGFIKNSNNVSEYHVDDLNLYVWIFKDSNCTVYFSDLVFLNLTCGDGFVNELYLLNKSEIKEVMDKLQFFINDLRSYYILPLFYGSSFEENINIDLVYAGIGAERVEITYITEYVVENDTLIPKKTPVVRFHNPYYKFYILYNGVRVGYPIKVGYEERNGSRVLKYVKMLVPNIGFNNTYSIFRVNDEYIEEIVELFNNVTGYNVTPEKIIIGDIYYYPTRDLRFLTPVLILYANITNSTLNKIVTLRLYPDSPRVESVTNILGWGYTAGDYLYIEKYILRVVNTGKHKFYILSPRGAGILYRDVTFLFLIPISVAIVSIAIYLIGKKKSVKTKN